jgi:hypothetical protein
LRILLREKNSKQLHKRHATNYQKTINEIKSSIDATPEELDHHIARLLEANEVFINRVTIFQQSKWVKHSINSKGSLSYDDLLKTIKMIDK